MSPVYAWSRRSAALVLVTVILAGCQSGRIAPADAAGVSKPDECCKPAGSAITDGKSIEIPAATPWIVREKRRPLSCLDARYTDQDEHRGTLKDESDRPTVLTFFYTRCQNTQKCSAAITQLGSLERTIARAGLAGRVHLLAVSFEPQWDDPARLKRFVLDRGMTVGQYAKAVRLDQDGHAKLIQELQVPVGYNAGWVNSHGLALYLLDDRGRLARTYHTVLWSNDDVVADLKKLTAERQ